MGEEQAGDGGCPIGGEFVPSTTDQLCGVKKVIVFSLPGAFTPTCSTYQLPGFEENYDHIRNTGIDEVRAMYSHLLYAIQTWPGSPARPPEEQEWLLAMKERYFAMLMEYNFSENESVDK